MEFSHRTSRGAPAPTRTAAPVVLSAAAFGIPPLAVVALVAGVSGQRRRLFAVLVLAGRGARFAAIVLPVSHLVG